jgi:hypothetical protein
MSRTLSRINIAKATLNLVNSGAVIPQAGIYLRPIELRTPGELRLEEALEKTSCYACAIGALMCGASTLSGSSNGISLSSSRSQDRMVKYIESDFSAKEIAKLEYFLESANYIAGRVLSDAQGQNSLVLSSEETKKIDEYKKINVLPDIDKITFTNYKEYEEKKREVSKELVTYLLTYIINNEGKLPF